eukprot:COSAG02_NODE_34748_length_478_cov_25.343008_1_plen_112_part_10
MRVPIPEPSSPSLTPFAPPRLFGGHFDDFACAAGGTKCYIGALGTSCCTPYACVARSSLDLVVVVAWMEAARTRRRIGGLRASLVDRRVAAAEPADDRASVFTAGADDTPGS